MPVVTTVLIVAIMLSVGFGALVAVRYARERTRRALIVAGLIAAETFVLVTIFVKLSLGRS